MSSTDRDQMMRRIRNALGDVSAAETPGDVEVPRDYLRRHSDGDIVDLFDERAADYRATVRRTAPQDVAETIADILEQRGMRRVLIPAGLPEEYSAATRAVMVRDEPNLPVADLDAADGVLTGCALAIAETGTLILDGGPGQGRRALTLLPDYHLCVVRAGQIAADVPDAVALLDQARPLTWISGPSATSDIENNRVEGVHGPRTLDILILDDRPGRPGSPEQA